jgi:hypothetical protein
MHVAFALYAAIMFVAPALIRAKTGVVIDPAKGRREGECSPLFHPAHPVHPVEKIWLYRRQD